MQEIWVDIKGYEGLYKISNYGRVKSLSKKIDFKGGYRISKEKILNTSLNNRGVYIVNLSKNNKYKGFTVCSLVAKHFLTKINEDDVVIHIKEKTNDCIDNLKYIPKSEMVALSNHKRPRKYLYIKANENGISTNRALQRFKSGWNENEIINIPVVRKKHILKVKMYKYNNKLYSVEELSKLSKKSKFALYKRLKNGWSIEEALEIPIAKGRR